MNAIVVYRYENNDGIGPYCGWDWNGLSGELCDAHTGDHNRPGWQSDGFSHVWGIKEEKFGCLSLDDLKRWFDGWESRLKKEGYNIKRYLVKSCIVGYSGKQCVFNMKSVLKVEDVNE